MPQELLYPFGLNATGGIAFTTDPNVMTLQHVEALVATNPGERVMLPTYGVPLASNVFAGNPDTVVAGVTSDVEQAMAYWEPTLTVLTVTPTLDPTDGYGIAAINVEYSQAANSNEGANTATVLVGGSVIQSITANAS